MYHIGTAGWSIPRLAAHHFDSPGTHLEKYSRRLSGVEINSCFYRDHQLETYQRWARSVPSEFEFSVKLNRLFTHEQRLKLTDSRLSEVVSGIVGLGDRLGALLVQLPPSLEFEKSVASEFFSSLRRIYNGALVCEPRHKSWVTLEGDALFRDFRISKVIADPDPCPPANREQTTYGGLMYFRLHGSPEMYKSNYDAERLAQIQEQLEDASTQIEKVWCIFDNTARGFAIHNALELNEMISGLSYSSSSPAKSPHLDPGSLFS